jgi:hypothetical protein
MHLTKHSNSKTNTILIVSASGTTYHMFGNMTADVLLYNIFARFNNSNFIEH